MFMYSVDKQQEEKEYIEILNYCCRQNNSNSFIILPIQCSFNNFGLFTPIFYNVVQSVKQLDSWQIKFGMKKGIS